MTKEKSKTAVVEKNNNTLMQIGGVDLMSIKNAEEFLDKQDGDVIHNSIPALLKMHRMAWYWTGATLNKQKATNYQTKRDYDSSKGGFYDYAEKEFGISRTTANKYISVYQVLTDRNIHACDVIDIGIEALYLIAKNADRYNDQELLKLLEFARENSEDQLEEYILGDEGKSSSNKNFGDFGLTYSDKQLEEFKSILESLKETYNTNDISKCVLNALIEFRAHVGGYITSFDQELTVLLNKHKIDHPNQVMNVISEIFEKQLKFKEDKKKKAEDEE